MVVALGIDVGTTSVKVAAVDACGKCLGLDVAEYELVRPRVGVVEADPEVYWERLPGAIGRVLGAAALGAGDIKGIALSSQGQTFVCLDHSGRPLDKAMVWLDTRATAEAKGIEAEIGLREFYRHTGVPTVSPSLTASMLLWLKRNRPHLYGTARRFALIPAYIALRGCGRHVIDETGAASSGLYDVQDHRWWPELLALIGLEEERLPAVVRSGQVIGSLGEEAAAFLGLQAGTPLVSGAWDQIAAAVGSGNLCPGRITETTGTALAVAVATDVLTLDPKARLLTIPHAAEGKGILLPFAPTSGIVLKWFRENLCSAGTTYDDLTALASGVPLGARGLLFVPHFSGTGSPSFDPTVKGAICGLRLDHTRADIVRALLESLAFVLRELVDIARELGVRPQSITSLGGGARSPLLCQLKADVLGIPVETLSQSEAALCGDAMLALVGVEVFSDLGEAASSMVRRCRLFEPDAGRHERYQEVFLRYLKLVRELYPSATAET